MRSLESSACFTALQQQIGDQLRSAYGPLLEEELPQRFSELIERLQGRMESVGENAAIGVTANKLSPYTDGGLELTGQAA